MVTVFNAMNFVFLAQNEAEKSLTLAGIIFMAIILFVLIIDSTAKYKSQYTPKSKKVQVFLWLFFIIVVVGGLILFRIYYK